MAELADAADSKSAEGNLVGVRPPLPAPNRIKHLAPSSQILLFVWCHKSATCARLCQMAQKTKQRGILERPPGSGVWWISYFGSDGIRHREKIGTRKAAEKRYLERKAEVRADLWYPSRRRRGVLLGDLIDDALLFVAKHKDRRNYISKAEIVRRDLGKQSATALTPQAIEKWLTDHCNTAATSNRYRAFLSLCFRRGIANGKVTTNPARSVTHRKESNGRPRFLSRDEYKRLRDVIAKRFPEHLVEFIVSVHTGMRLGEQYSATWSQVHVDRKTIELPDSKNGEPRTVHLNKTALEAIQSIRPQKVKASDPVFPREGEKDRFDTRSWFVPCMEEANIDGYVWHSNRHTFCSWLAMAGASTREIMEAAGHKTITMSARYAHLSPQHTASVVERLTPDANL
jgi:integrase